jgi:hypothetical protein
MPARGPIGERTRVLKTRMSADQPRVPATAGAHPFVMPGKLYSAGVGVYTNAAEEFFSRMRQSEIGHHHHIEGAYLVPYAQGAAYRQDHRRMDNRRRGRAVSRPAMGASRTVGW